MSTNPTPSICRIVRYRLDADDAQRINHERADSMLSKIGNPVQAGDEYPMIITKVWGDTPTSAVNGTVFLDGNHLFWATSVLCGEGDRTFSWPNGSRVERAQPIDEAKHPVEGKPQYETPSIKPIDPPGGVGTQAEPAPVAPPTSPPPNAQS
jgi:hypothetical protein